MEVNGCFEPGYLMNRGQICLNLLYFWYMRLRKCTRTNRMTSVTLATFGLPVYMYVACLALVVSACLRVHKCVCAEGDAIHSVQILDVVKIDDVVPNLEGIIF